MPHVLWSSQKNQFVDEIVKGRQIKIPQRKNQITYSLIEQFSNFETGDFWTIIIIRAGPGVSSASPWVRATPTPRQTIGEKKNYIIHKKKKKKLYT
jgi:hypothetical protein